MQVIFENKNKRSIIKRTNPMGIVLYVGRISWCIKRESAERLRIRRNKIQISRKFLLELKNKFREVDEESVKVAELKKIEQGGKIIKEFVQEF